MKNTILSIVILLVTITMKSQELNDILSQEAVVDSAYVMGTFNGTRILNGHAVETREKGVLEFLIQHRFGRLNSGSYNLFGLDESNIRIGLEYAISDDLSVAIGRSSFEKVYDGYIKYRFLRQKSDKAGSPLSLTFFGSITKKTLKDYDPNNKPTSKQRLAYTSQVLIARKISPSFSLQLSPTYIHFNKVPSGDDPNDFTALGIGFRLKLSNHMSLNTEYFYGFNEFKSMDTENSLAIGFDIETGGHVFQLIFSNSRAMIEKGFITETTGEFFSGDIHFGFNISRDFYLKPKASNNKIY